MSMIGNYRRMTAAELAMLREHPDRIEAFVYPPAGSQPSPEHVLDIDKTWHAIHFLLTGDPWEGAPPLGDVVLGGTPLGATNLGYGPARFLLPEQVRAAATALATLSFNTLEARFDLGQLAAADVYPSIWDETDRQDELDYLKPNYEALVQFFARAAESGDAMLLYIS